MHKIIIIGGGTAALTAADYLAEDAEVTLFIKGKRTNGNSWLAQGGIAGAIAANDSLKSHIDDTLKAGCFLNNRKMVEDMVSEGKEILETLEQTGSLFDKDKEGNILLGREGAHSCARVLHAGGDQTGKKLMELLTLKLHPAVKVQEDMMALDLLIENGSCRGVIVQDKQGNCRSFGADAVILATGGIGGLFNATSNDLRSTGDGLAMAWRAGAELQDLEYIQFHPTLLAGGNGLISEAVRGAGARLRLEDGTSVMKDIPAGDLAGRDITARKVYEQVQAGKQVFLDISRLNNFNTEFPQVAELCRKAGINLNNGKIPVESGAHFHMGGIKTDKWGRSSISSLYAIGETACTGVHGANRLASNSLLEALVFGKRCAEKIKETVLRESPAENLPIFFHRFSIRNDHLPAKSEIKNRVTEALGVVREAGGISKLLSWSAPLLSAYSSPGTPEDHEKMNMIACAHIIGKAALYNTNSLGAHFRSDEVKLKEKI